MGVDFLKKSNKLLCLKLIAAMITAFLILNIACIFYYNVPVHVPSKTNSTDYLWEKNKFYSRGTEGFALGITDNNGFNNLETFKPGQVDAIIMGSSHMEAFNVAQDKNTASVLNKLSRESGHNMNFYNIGTSGHTLYMCLNNLDEALNEFKPKKQVIIETLTVEPDEKIIKSLLDDTLVRKESFNDGFIGTLQKFPFLRLVYSQVMNFKNNNALKNTVTVANKPEMQKVAKTDNEKYQLMNTLMEKSAQMCKEAGVELIIFYNCSLDIDNTGSFPERRDMDEVKAFEEICKNNGIIFIDMYDSFKENYLENNKLPRGFSNTEIGEGHLNEEGHRVIANTLFPVVCK